MNDLLKRLSLRSPTFIGGLIDSGMQATTSSITINNTHLGQALQTL